MSLSTSITGSTLVLDQATGYLVPGDGYKLVGFGSDKKTRCVALAREYWPHLSRIAEAVGINRQTLSNHLELDAKFREDMEAAQAFVLDDAEATMRARAMTPGGFMDRIALLKAYRAERWNPELRAGSTANVSVTVQLASKAREYIDTTATDVKADEGRQDAQPAVLTDVKDQTA